MEDVFWGLMIPLLGTTLGAACVFFMRGRLHRSVQRGLTGFASGVMVAASFFSLLLPALEQSAPMGRWAFLPAVIGFGVGVDRKSTRLNSSHSRKSRMPSSA